MQPAEFSFVAAAVNLDHRAGVETVPLLLEELFLESGFRRIETPLAEQCAGLFGHRVVQKQVNDLFG